MGLHAADYCVLLLYFIVITLIGVWSARKLKNSNDFFMPRKFGKLMMLMFSFGTGTHPDQAVSVASKSFTNGLSGIWYQWLWLPVTPFYWLIAPIFRRFRAVTTADVFEARFDGSVAALYAFVGILNLSVNIGIMLKGAGAVISASTGYLVSANAAIAVMTILFVVYGVAGGLSAAIITDFIQGILTIFFSFALLPLIMRAVGDFEGIRSAVVDSELLSLVAPSDIGLFYISIIALNALVGIVTQPHTMSNCGAGKTELEGRIGFMGGTLLKRLCTIPWCLTGLAAIVYFAGSDIHPDKVFGAVAGDFLPKLVPGMLGLFLAALVASVMSSCDVFMVSSSALFTENIYRRFRPSKSAAHYILVARITAIIVVIGGVFFAYWLPNVVKGLEMFWKVSSMMGIAFWLGLFWRRTTVAGAWAATITAFAIWWLTTTTFFISSLEQVPLAKQLRLVTGQGSGMTIYLPWQMVFYLVCGTIAGILVSMLTKPVAKDKLDVFYALIRTPVQPSETLRAPCTLPEGAWVPERRKLFPKTNIEISVPSRTSIIGFLIGWICVAVLVGTVYFITQG
jgi:Na+/proline symporter